jgi:hypothetical protein
MIDAVVCVGARSSVKLGHVVRFLEDEEVDGPELLAFFVVARECFEPSDGRWRGRLEGL